MQNESSVEPFCLALLRLAKTMWRGGLAGLFGSMRYDLTCWRMLYFAKAIPLAATHTRVPDPCLSSADRGVFVSSMQAVTSPFQVTGNMAPA